jgi:hypothetical protein
VSASTSFTVSSAELVSLSVTPANSSKTLGLTQQFTATGTYTNGTTQDLTTTVTWSSSATGVATISTPDLESPRAPASPSAHPAQPRAHPPHRSPADSQ